jgi:hypothetical protein
MDETLLHFQKSDIFSPPEISKLMASKLHTYGNLLEPSVGEGDLLKYIDLNHYDNIDVYEIKEKYLEKIVSDTNNKKINKYHEDFIKANITSTYDNIIMNPPYIRIQDLSKEYRSYIKETFPIFKTGLVDLYYVFLLKCISLLNENGVMITITPNSYLYNKSSLTLKKYLFENKFIREIIDYKSVKVFEGKSVYCCITIFDKSPKDYLIYNNTKIYYKDIDTKEYNIFNTINTSNANTNNTCTTSTTSTTNKKLKDICKIKNGIATLREKIYIHEKPLYPEEPCWKPITNGKKKAYIIFPYDDNGKILDEEEFQNKNLKTYTYLQANRLELSKRDKGNKTYPKWYAFGRTQALIKSKKEKVLYIQTFMNPSEMKLEISEPMLFYGCLCIEPIHTDTELIEKTIIKNIDMLTKMSSKRGGGWINISSRNLYELPFQDNIKDNLK